MVNDAHCHFFSATFFATLGNQMPPPIPDDPAITIPERLGWEPPGSPEALADQWVSELETHGVNRAAVMASVPGDEGSVEAAVRRHPNRLVGMTMVDPTSPDARTTVRNALGVAGFRCICLFPAMHGYTLGHEGVDQVFRSASEASAAVFVHCGVLTVGVRRKLGLKTRVDIKLGDPLAIVPIAFKYPKVPVIIPHFGAGFLREIDASTPDINVWKFLHSYVVNYDASIFPMPGFAQQLTIPQYMVPPSIDPLSDKNRDLSNQEVQRS